LEFGYTVGAPRIATWLHTAVRPQPIQIGPEPCQLQGFGDTGISDDSCYHID